MSELTFVPRGGGGAKFVYGVTPWVSMPVNLGGVPKLLVINNDTYSMGVFCNLVVGETLRVKTENSYYNVGEVESKGFRPANGYTGNCRYFAIM